ncbi:7559_t:CDS:1, partial [Funneliformis mosseae]
CHALTPVAVTTTVQLQKSLGIWVFSECKNAELTFLCQNIA